MRIKEIIILAGVFAMSMHPLIAQDAKLAEDPFVVNQKEHKQNDEKVWLKHSHEELRVWAKANLHHKVTAKRVIYADVHPEWAWFRKSGLGLFLHWGLPSANPNTGDAWSIIYSEKKEKLGIYIESPSQMFAVADSWNPEEYNPEKWLSAAKKAGFGYSVLTTRHHDGYALWPSEYGVWDTGDYMGGRDLISDYVEASRNNDMRIGFYYSGPNWHYDYKNRRFDFPSNDDYMMNYKHEKVSKDSHLHSLMGAASPDQTEQSKGQVRELLTNYGPIDVIWWDGNIAMQDEELRPMQPHVFVARGNIATPEGNHQGASENVKVTNECGWWWESCQKSENSFTPNWHYGVECETNHWDTNTLLTELIRCRALGGNLLVNIPPRGNGEMMDWYYDVCAEMSAWMAHSREATYDVDLDAPLPMLDKTMNFTTKRGNVYYSLADDKNTIFISDVSRPKSVSLLRTGEKIEFEFREEAIRIEVPVAMQTDLPDMVKIEF